MAARHWGALDTRAAQLLAANAVLLGLAVGASDSFLPSRMNSGLLRTVLGLLFLGVLICLIGSFLQALAAWRFRTIQSIPASLAVIELFQEQDWTAEQTVKTLAYRVANAVADQMEQAKGKANHLKSSMSYLRVAAILVALLAIAPVSAYVFEGDPGGDSNMGQDKAQQDGNVQPTQGDDAEPVTGTGDGTANPWDNPRLPSELIEKGEDIGRLERR